MNEEITRVLFRKWFTGAILAALALMVVLLLLPGVSCALTLDQMPLVGLKGMAVLVEDIVPEAKRLGLTKGQIQTDVELSLRKAGVKVLTMEETAKTPGMPYLYVNVTAVVRPGSPLCAYNIFIVLKEWVTLASGFGTVGEIWHVSVTGTVGIDKITQIRGVVGDQVDSFINDYLAANPK